MIDVVVKRVAELENLFKELELAHKNNNYEQKKSAMLALGNTTVSKKNLITGLEILIACGIRSKSELGKWK